MYILIYYFIHLFHYELDINREGVCLVYIKNYQRDFHIQKIKLSYGFDTDKVFFIGVYFLLKKTSRQKLRRLFPLFCKRV